MMDVVNKGTGNQAYIKGMNIGGKTGTTEYYDKGRNIPMDGLLVFSIYREKIILWLYL